MEQGSGRIRYFEVGLIVAVVAVLAMLLRPAPEKKPDPPNLADVRQDLLSVMTPIWNVYDNDLTLACPTPHVLDVRLSLNPATPPRRFWLNQVVEFVCANQPRDPGLRPGQVEAEVGKSTQARIPGAPPAVLVVDAEISKRGNDLLTNVVGPQKALLLVETPAGPVPPVSDDPAPDETRSALVERRQPAAGAPAGPALPSATSGDSALDHYSRRARAYEAPRYPRPSLPAARAYLVLSSQLNPDLDEKLQNMLLPILTQNGRGAPVLTLLHLPKHTGK